MSAAARALRFGAGLSTAASVMLGTLAAAHPFSMNDLMALRRATGAYLSPDERFAVIGLTEPYDRAGTYGDNRRTALALNRLYRLDLAAKAPRLRRLGPAKTGLSSGPFSPTGRRMAIFRLRRAGLELGVADLGSGTLHWSRQPGRTAGVGQSVAWLSEGRLLFLSPLPGSDPTTPQENHRRRTVLWRRTAEGRSPAVVRFDGGRVMQGPLPATTALKGFDVFTGRVQTLAVGRFDDLELSPSRRFVALSEPVEDAALAGQAVLGFSDVLPRRRLAIFDRSDRRLVRPCPDCDLAPTLLSWSPQADRLLIFLRRPGSFDWREGKMATWSPSGVQPLPMKGLEATVGAYGSEALLQPAAAWQGERPLVFAHRPGETRSDWYRVETDGAHRLTQGLVKPAPRLLRVETDGFVTFDEGRTVRVDGSGAVAAAEVPATLPEPRPGIGLRRSLQNPTGEPAEPASLVAPPGWTPIAARRGAAILRSLDDHSVTRLALKTGAGLTSLAVLNGHLAGVNVRPPIRFSRSTPSGTVTDWLYLPSGRAGAKPPLVVVPYPGYRYEIPPWMARLDGTTYTVSVQRLAAEGFAVLVPSLPFDASEHEPAKAIGDAMVDAIEFGRQRPEVDGERIAVVGHSYGGYTALLAATRCPGLAAVIAAAAPSDLIGEYGVFPALSRLDGHASALRGLGLGWTEGGQGDLAATPQADPERYLRNSPLFAADRVRAPLLLIYGDEDLVGLAQGEEMFSALKRRDRDVRLMVLVGEDHTLTSPANLREEDHETIRFLKTAFQRPRREAPICVGAGQPQALVP